MSLGMGNMSVPASKKKAFLNLRYLQTYLFIYGYSFLSNIGMPTNSNEYTRTWNPQKVGLEDDFPNAWQFVVSMLMLDAVYIKLYKYSTNMGGLPNGNSVLTHKINVDNRSVATLKSLRSG